MGYHTHTRLFDTPLKQASFLAAALATGLVLASCGRAPDPRMPTPAETATSETRYEIGDSGVRFSPQFDSAPRPREETRFRLQLNRPLEPGWTLRMRGSMPGMACAVEPTTAALDGGSLYQVSACHFTMKGRWVMKLELLRPDRQVHGSREFEVWVQ